MIFNETGTLKKIDGEYYIKFNDGSALNTFLKYFEDKEVNINLTDVKKHRSKKLVNFLWCIVYPTIKAWHQDTAGETLTLDQIHVWCLTHYSLGFNLIYNKDVNGVVLEGKTLRDMTHEECSTYLKNIQKHYAKLDLFIPDPEKIKE